MNWKMGCDVVGLEELPFLAGGVEKLGGVAERSQVGRFLVLASSAYSPVQPSPCARPLLSLPATIPAPQEYRIGQSPLFVLVLHVLLLAA